MARIMPTIQGRKKVQKKALSSSKITKPPKPFGRALAPTLIRVKKKTAKGRKSRTIKSVEIRARDGDSSQGGVQPTAQDEPQFRLFPKLVCLHLFIPRDSLSFSHVIFKHRLTPSSPSKFASRSGL
jgi:hypothetical protein